MSVNLLRPPRLSRGDTVAVLSPSWGGPSIYPNVFELGLRNLENLFGLKIKEYPTARMADAEIYANPKARAEDINRAFADPEVKGIIASIGGDDSVRILPYLDLDTIFANPKILMGYSDTTTLTSYLNQNGLVTFNGPSVMAGFAQMRHLPADFVSHVREILFEPTERYEYRAYPEWADKYRPWQTPDYDGETEALRANEGARWLQGEDVVQGRLFGGCIEVLEFMKSTRFWPAEVFWDGKILFFETSEDKPTVPMVKYMLRNYGSMGALDRIAGILYGRARAYTGEEKESLYKMMVQVVAGEFGRRDMPIVANMDFGHTDPQWVMPLGVMAEIDPVRRTLCLVESAVD